MNRQTSTLSDKTRRRIADSYSPFRDPNPPNYLKYGRPVSQPKAEERRFVVYRFGLRVEFRGTVPGGIYNYIH